LIDTCEIALKLPKLLVIFFAITVVTLATLPIGNYLRGSTKDYGKWYLVGQMVLEGSDIYTERRGGKEFDFMYPPPAAMFFAVLSYFGELSLIIILVLLYSVAWIASVLLSIYVATGTTTPRNSLLYLVPGVCCLPYVVESYLLGQPNLLLLSLMLGAFACLRTDREWIAGFLIALAAGIKAFPVLALGYFVYRKYWKATISCVGLLIVLLVILPAPFRGFDRNLQDLNTWAQGMVRYDAGSISQRQQRGFSWSNHSLIAVAHRLLRPVNAHRERNETLFVNIAEVDFKTVNIVIIIVAAGLCLFYILCMPRENHRTVRSDALEQAMLLLLILIFTPLAFTYFFVWLFYPLVVAMHLVLMSPAGTRQCFKRWTWFWVSVLPLSFTIPIAAFRPFQAAGSTLITCLLLLAGFGWHLWGEASRTPLQESHTR
jgi:hypothetical protein